jgi:limonene-1,2-epoxide hydrolase
MLYVMGVEQEQVVLEFLEACTGRIMDVEAASRLMTDDIVWQVNVPLAQPIVGLDAARAELERQSKVSSGMLEGSELLAIASNGRTVFTERVDVVQIGRRPITFRISGIFEVRYDKVSAWREYFDTSDAARQLGVDPAAFYEGVGTAEST